MSGYLRGVCLSVVSGYLPKEVINIAFSYTGEQIQVGSLMREMQKSEDAVDAVETFKRRELKTA